MRRPTVRRNALVLVALAVAVLGGCGNGDERVDPERPGGGTSCPADPDPTPPTDPGSTTDPAPTSLPPTTAATSSSSTTADVGPTSPPGPAVEVRQGRSDRRLVALTFDAGSDTGHAAAILDTLRSERIRATFGMTGSWAERNQALVCRMVDEGHQLVNHTYDHPSFTGFSTGDPPLDRGGRLDQLRRTEELLAAAGTSGRPWFRPPYGDTDEGVAADVGSAGYRWILLWSIDTLGWKGLSASDITARVLDSAAPGAIVLAHVGAASADAAALPDVIRGLRARGYGLATAEQIVG